MTTINYRFALSEHVGFPPPAVAAAVDLNANNKADAGETILLSPNGLEWTGTKDISKDLDELVVMTVFMASVQAKYEIEITDSSGKVLATMKGVVHQQPQAQFLMLVNT